ncbi:unnamed protein product [Nezara viridula]|uniref:Uncharacterized protein n=1 Tax=Nezara viridula TaxID=85310 RepID=A0A9P0MKY4_NEZVI|nr:unnamed protein product [Nezara viridula]
MYTYLSTSLIHRNPDPGNDLRHAIFPTLSAGTLSQGWEEPTEDNGQELLRQETIRGSGLASDEAGFNGLLRMTPTDRMSEETTAILLLSVKYRRTDLS